MKLSCKFNVPKKQLQNDKNSDILLVFSKIKDKKNGRGFYLKN